MDFFRVYVRRNRPVLKGFEVFKKRISKSREIEN